MLPVIIGAAAALLLGACSREEEKTPVPKSALPAKPTSSAKTPGKVTYKKSCLADSSCSPAQRIAAAQDYAVNIYGPKKSTRFDGILFPSEQKMISSRWGAPQTTAEILGFFDKAHTQFLSQHADPNSPLYCSMGSLYHFVRAGAVSEGQAAALLGPHQCGAQYAALFANSGLEAEIASDQEQWIFFIESSREADHFAKLGVAPVEEYALFVQVAQGLEIPVINPLVSLDDPLVAAAMELHGLTPKAYAVVLAVARINDAFPATAEQRQDLAALSPDDQIKTRLALLQSYFSKPDPRNLNANALATLFGIAPENFYAACLDLVTPKPGEDPIGFFSGLKKHLSETADQAIVISNRLSVQRVKDQLQQTSRPKAFFQMGAEHQPILKEVYGSSREIPLRNILTNK